MKRQIEPIIKLFFLISIVILSLYSLFTNQAHAAWQSTWNGGYQAVAYNPAGAEAHCENVLNDTSADFINRITGSGVQHFACRLNGFNYYPDGRKYVWLIEGGTDADYPPDTIDPDGVMAPQAPDISSCTRSSISFNTGTADNRNFPNVSQTWTDSDGCQYQIDTDSGSASDIILECATYPESDNPDDIWCKYKSKPTGTTLPPTGENPDEPQETPLTTPVDQSTPIQEDTKNDLIVDWESWEPNPPHTEERQSPNDVITITLPDGGTVDVTIDPDGKISIDYGDYSPNQVPIMPGPNGYPQPNPGYVPPGGGTPGGSGPSGGSQDGPIGVPGVGGTGGGSNPPGDGDGDGDQDNEDYTYQSPPGKDDLYQKSDKTFQTVLDGFVTSAQQAPMFHAVSGFFDVNLSGTCPVWTIPETPFTPALIIDHQCSQTMNQLWPFVAAILLAVAGWFAFRWAVL